MILVDSSVWIDYFRGIGNQQTDNLDQFLDTDSLVVGDLILTEVLQGCTTNQEFARLLDLLTSFPVVELGGQEIAIQAARNFRTLRRLGITVRKTIDAVIATRCIQSGYFLLHNDRDFDPFVQHLGLRVV